MTQSVIQKSPEILGGITVFYGTRVPAQTLIDYLAAGDTIDAFLSDFPSVTRQQVLQFLEQSLSHVADEHSN